MTAERPTTSRAPAAGARPELPALDREAVEAEVDRVRSELRIIESPRELVEHASVIANESTRELATLRPARDAAALSLSFYDNVRGLFHAAGVNRQRFIAMRRRALGLGKTEAWMERREGETLEQQRARVARRARRRGIERIPDAAETLPDLAFRTAVAEGTAEVAREYRDQATVVLWKCGVGRRELHALWGEGSASRISQIITDSGARDVD